MLNELIAQGGPVMYVLLICSLVSIAIILERAYFWLTEVRRSSIRETITSLRAQGKLQELARILRKESERAYERSTKFLSGLDTIVSITPLLGILGTVLGIMKSFHALDLQHMASPGEVSHGLAEAMLTTAVGLTIAVPTLVFYNFYHSLAARHAAALYKLSEDIGDSVSPEHQSEESDS